MCSHVNRIVNNNFVYRYKVEVSGKSLPVLTNLDKGKYGVIVFENLSKYLQMDKWNRELLDKYCREYSVGIVGFNPPSEETLVGAQLRGFPLFIHTNLRLKVIHSLTFSFIAPAESMYFLSFLTSYNKYISRLTLLGEDITLNTVPM